MNANDPQTDREMILMAITEMKSLRDSVNRLTDTFEKFEETKIVSIESRLEKIESWQSQLRGGWKLVLLLWALFTAAVVALIKQIF